MARGFLAGAIWGVVVSAVGAGALSVAMGPPANRPAPPQLPIATDPVAEAVDSLTERAAPPSGTPEPETPEDTAQAEAPDATPEPVAPAEVTEEAPSTRAPGAEEAVEPAPEELPEVAVVEAESAPEVVSEEPETPAPPPARRPSEEQGVDTASAGPALSAPALIEGGTPDTRPTQRPEAIAAPDAPDTPGASEAARVAVGGDAPVQPGLPALPPEAPLAEEKPALSTDPAQPPQPSQDSSLAPEPEAPAQEPRQEPADPVISEEPEAAADIAPATEEPAAPRVTALVPDRPVETSEAEGPGIGRPANSLIDRGPESAEEPETEAPPAATLPESRLPVITGDTPAAPARSAEAPLRLYAAASDVAADEPAMSILLIDDGAGPLGPDTVEAFPFPVSFAISPSHPDPAAAAAGYRARGFEVLALADLPENATPVDAEVALQGALSTVPEAVAVLESEDLALQHNRAVSEQAAEFLAASGHGLVMMPNGLNTAEALARRAGVPSLTVFRDFDGKGQDPRVMRRFLDQAAFKARQEENVVMLGRLRADTVSALLLWGLQDRANSVALVPVSALLLRQDAAD